MFAITGGEDGQNLLPLLGYFSVETGEAAAPLISDGFTILGVEQRNFFYVGFSKATRFLETEMLRNDQAGCD